MLVEDFVVQSPNVSYTDEFINSTYNYESTKLSRTEKGSWIVTPTSTQYQFRVDRRVPKLGVMMVGLGGNNGTTVTAGILANKSWHYLDDQGWSS
jgi:myo-inositol-1-phosphate synthase